MDERNQIATILGILVARRVITSWEWIEQDRVALYMPGVIRTYTFLQFWTLFSRSEQALASGSPS